MTDILFWALSLTGHIGIWCRVFNRTHAFAFPRRRQKFLERLIYLAVFLPVIWVLVQWIRLQSLEFQKIQSVSNFAFYYGVVCIFASFEFIISLLELRSVKPPKAVVQSSSEKIDVQASRQSPLLHGALATLLGKIPFNQVTQLAIEHRTFKLNSLPKSLSGLRVSHLSDLHFMDHVAEAYFDEVVRRSNEFEPDVVVLTGDIVDKASCLPWINSVLGKLKAKHGKYYVLGNHDLKIRDESRVREHMQEIGFVGLNDQWEQLDVSGSRIWLAGNELPWFKGALGLPKKPPGWEHEKKADFRILLSHSPDQFPWALEYKFDLMFAGHTHGGQIRFPILGPMVAPSRYGVKYCSGTFQVGETGNMLMHVSRGLSGDDAIRINCPPELGLITLQSAK